MSAAVPQSPVLMTRPILKEPINQECFWLDGASTPLCVGAGLEESLEFKQWSAIQRLRNRLRSLARNPMPIIRPAGCAS